MCEIVIICLCKFCCSCVSSCVCVSHQEAALWTAHETSPPATRHTSRLPPPEGHCFISLHRLSVTVWVYSHLCFHVNAGSWTGSETRGTGSSEVSVRQKEGRRENMWASETRGRVDLLLCEVSHILESREPVAALAGSRGLTGWLMHDRARPLHSQHLCLFMLF